MSAEKLFVDGEPSTPPDHRGLAVEESSHRAPPSAVSVAESRFAEADPDAEHVESSDMRAVIDSMTATVAGVQEWRAARRLGSGPQGADHLADPGPGASPTEPPLDASVDNCGGGAGQPVMDDVLRRAAAQLAACSRSAFPVGAAVAGSEAAAAPQARLGDIEFRGLEPVALAGRAVCDEGVDGSSSEPASHASALRLLTAESFAQRASSASAGAGRRDPLVASALDDSRLSAARRAAGAAAALGQLDASALQMHAALLARQRMRELGLEDEDGEQEASVAGAAP